MNHNNESLGKVRPLAIALAMFAIPCGAQAQERSGGSRLLEEVVVTAQKRAENIQDVPISIQAFGEEMLDARGIVDQTDLQFVTPTLEIGTQISYTTVYLRGVGTDAFLTADPSVATYIDGVYFPFSQGLAQDFGAVERIEVLKGPQGTLFGRNATGGALNIITKQPEFDSFYVKFQSTFADYPERHSRIHFNVPFSDKFAASLSLIDAETDYYIEGTIDRARVPEGRELEPIEDSGFRVKLRWMPTDWLDVTVAHFQLEKSGTGGNFMLNRYATDLLLQIDSEQDRIPNETYRGDLSAPTFNNLENEVTYAQVQFFTPYFDIKVLGSDQLIDTQGVSDFDGSDSPIMHFEPEKNYADIQTAEIQFISNPENTPAWLKWIAGAYYFKGESGFDPIIGRVEDPLFLPSIGLAFPDLSLSLLTGALLSGHSPLDDIYISAVVGTESLSYFMQTTITLAPWMDLTLGLRDQVEKRELLKAFQGFRDSSGNLGIAQEYDYATRQDGTIVPGKDKTHSLSPKVSFDFRPFDGETLIYLSYQEATKSATYNATVISAPPTYALPEEMTAWELGTKTTLFDRVSLSAAIFRYDINNLQTQFLALANGGVVSFENAKKAQIRGLDFDLTAELLPGLVLTGGAGWLPEAKYASYPNAAGYEGNTGSFSRGNDLSGKRIVRTPEFTASFALSQTFDVPGGPLELTVDYYYNDGIYYESNNNPRSEQKAYELFGARISYLLESLNLRLTLFGKNIGNEVYSQGAVPNDFGYLPTIGAPATYGLRVSYEFFAE